MKMKREILYRMSDVFIVKLIDISGDKNHFLEWYFRSEALYVNIKSQKGFHGKEGVALILKKRIDALDAQFQDVTNVSVVYNLDIGKSSITRRNVDRDGWQSFLQVEFDMETLQNESWYEDTFKNKTSSWRRLVLSSRSTFLIECRKFSNELSQLFFNFVHRLKEQFIFYFLRQRYPNQYWMLLV